MKEYQELRFFTLIVEISSSAKQNGADSVISKSFSFLVMTSRPSNEYLKNCGQIAWMSLS